MLIPRNVRGKMVWTDNAPFELQRQLQAGCNDGCGWSGDPYLILRAIPHEYMRPGDQGWCVIDTTPGQKNSLLWTGRIADHRLLVWLQQAQWNARHMGAVLQAAEDHDAKYEAEEKLKEVEMKAQLAQFVRRQVRKEGHL